MVGIYKITSPSGKVYIGQSWDIDRRFFDYINKGCNSQTHLSYSFKKYGAKNHSFEIASILPDDVSQDILNQYEIVYWEQYKSCGFKMLNVREPGSKGKIAAESKEKMSIRRKELLSDEQFSKRNNEQLNRMADKRKGSKNTKEHTEKIRAYHTGRKRPIKTCERISDGKRGKKIKPYTEERKRRKSEAQKGKPRPELKGRKFSDKRKANMQKGMIGKKKRINPAFSRKGIIYRRGRVGIIDYSFGNLN